MTAATAGRRRGPTRPADARGGVRPARLFEPRPEPEAIDASLDAGLDAGLLDEAISRCVAFCVQAARNTVRDACAPVDLYTGSSGLGLELLHHTARPGVAEAVDLLAHWTARHSRGLPAGLYSGRTGVALFLQRAGILYHDDDPLPRDRPDGGSPGADLLADAAGIGVGHLLLLAGSDDVDWQWHLAVAAECHRILMNSIATLTPTDAAEFDGAELGIAEPGTAAPAAGIARGEAGIAFFLTEYTHATGDLGARAAARAICDRLAARTPDVIARAMEPDAGRRDESWFRELTIIGRVLLRAADRLGEPRYRELARLCADTCVLIAPHMPRVGQCCGLAGVGDFLIDTAAATGDESRWHEAGTVARAILTRGGGTWSHPAFLDGEPTPARANWSAGSSGVLAFLRRLRDRRGSRLATPL